MTVSLTGGGANGIIGDGDDTTETTTTDSDGFYEFTGLNPGEEYQVTFEESTLPDGFEFTAADQGGDDTADSDADANGVTPIVTLDPGENNPTIDAGIVEVPTNPDIDIEKFTNGVDADSPDEAPEVDAGETVTWTYEVTNTGDVPFDESEVNVTDDQEGVISNIIDQGNGDSILSPGETWIYEQTGTAQDLSTGGGASQDITFYLTGNSYTTGYAGNVRTFSKDGVSVDVSAFSSNKSGSGWKTAFLGAYGGGLGVTNQNESGSLHRVDNGTSNDYILFEFDRDVVVDRAFLSYISGDSDASFWIGDRNGDISMLNSSILNSFTKENKNGGKGGHNASRWANFNADELTGNTLVVAARTNHHNDAFKLKKLDISVPGETEVGVYKNIGTVVAGDVSDEDPSHYTNGEPEPENPGIAIEKFTNGVDADSPDEAPEIAAGETVTWTYEVTNTGDVPFAKSEISVTDDQEGVISNITSQGDGDNTLAPGETWIYEETGVAENLVTSTGGGEDITFYLTGNSYTTGHAGNVRTFSKDGVSVDVSAFSSNKSGSGWKTAFLGAYGGGLGVTNQNESGSLHRVDNGTSNDYILFEFDRDVVVDRAFLSYISGDSDASFWIGDRNGDISMLNSSILNSFTKENNNDNSYNSSRWADFNADELTGNTLVVAARTDHSHDAFKLKKLDISLPGETEVGTYKNVGTVTAGSVSDSDTSHYTNSDDYDEVTGEPKSKRKFNLYCSNRKSRYSHKFDYDGSCYISIVDASGDEMYSGHAAYGRTFSGTFDGADKGFAKVYDDKGGRLLETFSYDFSGQSSFYSNKGYMSFGLGNV